MYTDTCSKHYDQLQAFLKLEHMPLSKYQLQKHLLNGKDFLIEISFCQFSSALMYTNIHPYAYKMIQSRENI